MIEFPGLHPLEKCPLKLYMHVHPYPSRWIARATEPVPIAPAPE